MNVIGIDACRRGWCGVGRIDGNIISCCFKNLTVVTKTCKNLNRILIDIPIGLSSRNFSRTVDAKARKLLNTRKSSIFSPPSREALYTESYKEALQINRQIEGKGISIQAYNIAEKIKEVDEWIDRNTLDIEIFEAHPELCFKSLNQNKDLKFSKHDKAGLEERKSILFNISPGLKNQFQYLMRDYLRKEVKPDDILDAMALYLINCKSEKLKVITDENKIDETGKNIGIVYDAIIKLT